MVHHLPYSVMGKVDSALGQGVEVDSVAHTGPWFPCLLENIHDTFIVRLLGMLKRRKELPIKPWTPS